jgi:hypothetical protein
MNFHEVENYSYASPMNVVHNVLMLFLLLFICTIILLNDTINLSINICFSPSLEGNCSGQMLQETCLLIMVMDDLMSVSLMPCLK